MHEDRLCLDPDPNAANCEAAMLELEDGLWADASTPRPDAIAHEHASAGPAIMQNAMNVLGLCIIVVDSRLQVLYANAASRTHAACSCAGFALTRRVRGGGTSLSLASSTDTLELRRQVAAAIAESPAGTSCARRRPFHPFYICDSICLISPFAGGLFDPMMVARFRHAALLIFKPFATVPKPPPGLLRSLFRFTRAEAEVASDLVGGISAEDVARRRDVQLDTVRSQIRSILSKSGTPNLRAFENRIGSIMALFPPDPDVFPKTK